MQIHRDLPQPSCMVHRMWAGKANARRRRGPGGGTRRRITALALMHLSVRITILTDRMEFHCTHRRLHPAGGSGGRPCCKGNRGGDRGSADAPDGVG